MPTTPPSRNPIPLVDLAAPTADDGRPLPFRHRRPPWLTVRAPWGATFWPVVAHMRSNALQSVCAQARRRGWRGR